MANKQHAKRGLNVTLGVLGVLLAGIEIGKHTQNHDITAALTMACASIATLLSGNIETFLSYLPKKKDKNPE
jgi:hypothetical protein